MNTLNKHGRGMLLSGLAFGVGLLFGNVVSYFLAGSVSARRFLGENQGAALVAGIVLAFFIMGIGGLIGGALGGYSLTAVGHGKTRFAYAWRSGITFGIGYGLLIFPVFLIITLLSFYEVANIPFVVFGIVFALVGLVFGLIMGGSLGIWTVGRRFALITRSSALGFGLGGFGLGYGLWRFLLSVSNGRAEGGQWLWLALALLLFGGLGGAALGFAYSRTAERARSTNFITQRTPFKRWVRRVMIIGGLLFVLALLVRPVIAAVGDLLTPIDAGLSPVLDLSTTGTHWLDGSPLAAGPDAQAVVAAGANGRVAAAWTTADELMLQQGQWTAPTGPTAWQPPQQILAEGALAAAQIAIDAQGRVLVVAETAAGLVTLACDGAACSDPVPLAAPACDQPLAGPDRAPTLVASGAGALLVWQNSGQLPYAIWTDAVPTAVACVPAIAQADSHALAAGPDETAVLVAASGGEVQALTYADGGWQTPLAALGAGRLPDAAVDARGNLFAAWCTAENSLVVWQDGSAQPLVDAPCAVPPQLGIDSDGQLHVVWLADEIENVNGRVHAQPLLLESVQTADGWTEPAIVGGRLPDSHPQLAVSSDGVLHLVWHAAEQWRYAAQVQYGCEDAGLSELSARLAEIGRDPAYIPAGDDVAHCGNRYDALLITPNPNPAFSDAPRPANGVFDTMGDLIRAAEHEVIYSTMWYDAPVNNDSPGAVLAGAIADLYAQVQARPEAYPRGMTVRIMLGNPPEFTQGDVTGQLWTLLGDLRAAGIDKMVDPELGWRLQVADFEGNMPHSHVKTLIIDGKQVAANGFNTSYSHFPSDHPSGKGTDRLDLGLLVTGPVAQPAVRMFDDMWQGADERYCLNLNPPYGLPWQATCFDRTAVADHAPEVLKVYLPGDDTTAFSLYRSRVHDAADRQTVAAIEGAQTSLDIIQVNFTLDTVCNLNILFDVCTVDVSPDYMPALMDAARRGVNLRVLVKPGPVEGIENNVALDAINQRLEALGVKDRVEVRFYEGDMHPKVMLVDDQMLIVGSQNFHYSAFGTGSGLTEYSLAVEGPQAVADFQALFEYVWGQSVPTE